jgi:hypothetical protein
MSFVYQSFVNHYNRPRDVCLSFCGYVVCVFVCLFVYSESYLVPETDEGLFPDVPPEDEEAEDVLESQPPKNVAPTNSARVSGKDRAERNLFVKICKILFLAFLASFLFIILNKIYIIAVVFYPVPTFQYQLTTKKPNYFKN